VWEVTDESENYPLAGGHEPVLQWWPRIRTSRVQCRVRRDQVDALGGTVTKVEWTNPHARFYIDVKDANGTATNWNFELGSPLVLRRQGWTRDSLKEGDQVTVEGYPAKDGAKLASAKKITLADGRTVFGGLPTDASPSEYKQQ